MHWKLQPLSAGTGYQKGPDSSLQQYPDTCRTTTASKVERVGLCSFASSDSFTCTDVALKVAQLCPTLCDPMDYTAYEILQVRILEWVAVPFSWGIFPTQGLKPGPPHCRRILYQPSYQGSHIHLTSRQPTTTFLSISTIFFAGKMFP